jgi:glycosyltransferase involved in cell wall biosynthesis
MKLVTTQSEDQSSSSRASAAFLFDLIQDVNVLRPIVRTLAQDMDLDLLLLFSWQFEGRDKQWLWRAELDELAAQCGARMVVFDSPFSAVQSLQGGRGVIFSASESNLAAHATNHQVFLSVPAGYTRITVQHGYECVGFNHNREQTLAHGSAVRFAADILCGWGPKETLRHLCPSERDKYVELGPPVLLNRLFDRPKRGARQGSGLVCENLHSVRMRTTGNFQATYLSTLLAFADSQARQGRRVALRPHPGGQFVIKNRIKLPQNLILANKPMFKTDLAGFDYGISAPSSVLIDMVQAGIPTAVWCDSDAVLDVTAYAGLARVNTVDDWNAFAETATRDPEHFLERQAHYLQRTGLGVDPQVVRHRLVRLVEGVLSPGDGFPLGVCDGRVRASAAAPRTVLLVANGIIPTLHISFLKPLAELERQGRVKVLTITEKDILAAKGGGRERGAGPGAAYALERVELARPDLAVFCRYSGPEAEPMVALLRETGVPVVFHIDDDLLNVPRELGEKKFLEHNRAERTSTVRFLLENADVVYCSTKGLRERFQALGVTRDLYAGAIYCSGEVAAPADLREVRTIGFMGNDKSPELAALVPAIVQALRKYPFLGFELFGSMTMPPELEALGDRVQRTPPIGDYDAFVAKFRNLSWDIGLCPLQDTPFNMVKADTKWVDYTSIGAAVIASRGTAYDACCSDGCGILADSLEDWSSAIDLLVSDPARRYAQVRAAQEKLREQYSLARLTEQVMAVFDAAGEQRSAASLW